MCYTWCMVQSTTVLAKNDVRALPSLGKTQYKVNCCFMHDILLQAFLAVQPALVVERQVIGWFKVEHEDPNICTPSGKFPVFLLQDEDDFWYGFPQFGHQGLKIGKFDHAPGVVVPHPENISRQITTQDEQVLQLCMLVP